MIIGLILIPGRLFAQYVWSGGSGGGTDGNWETATDWTPNGIPGAGDTAIINNDSTITIPNAETIDTLIINTSAATFADGGAGSLTATASATLGGGCNANDVDLTLPAVTLAADTVITMTSGTLTITGTVDGDFDLTLDAGATGSLSLTGSFGTTIDNLTIQADAGNANTLTLPAIDIDNDLTITMADAASITQSGAFDVSGGTTTIDAAAAAITLDTATNDFGTVAVTNGASASIQDTNALILGTSALTGTFTVVAGGNITQSGDIEGDTLLVTTLNDAGAAITLNNAGNDFASVSLRSRNDANGANSSGVIAYRDNDDFDIVAPGIATTNNLTLQAAGDVGDGDNPVIADVLTVTLGGNDLDFANTNGTNDFNTVAISSGAASIRDADDIAFDVSTVSGNLTIQAGGNITQSGDIYNDGYTTEIIAGAADVTLTDAGNDFGTVAVTNGATVSIRDTDDLEIGTSSVSGALTLQTGGTVGDNLTQIGAISNDGQTTTIIAGAANVTLTNASNDFGTVAVTNGATVSIVDSDDLEIGTSTVSGDLTLQTGGTVGDNLTQIGAISNDGQTTTIIAVAANVTLENTGNNFGTVAVTSGATVSIVDSNELILGTSTVSDTYTVVAGGDITQSGVLSVTSTSSFTAPGGDSVTLDAGWNDLQGTIDFNYSSGTSLLNVTLYNTPAITMAAIAVSGTLELRSRDSVGQSGILSGDTLIVTTYNDAGGAITLENAGNAFASVSLRSRNLADGASAAGAISYRDVDGFDVVEAGAGLSGMETSGSLTLRGDGNVGDGDNPIIAGTLTVNLNNNDLDFSNSDGDSDFDTVNLGTIDNVNDASFRDMNAIILGTCTVTGTLTVVTGLGATHSITQSGVVTASGGITTLQAGAGAITLDDASNNFATVVITSGAAVSIRDTDALIIGTSTVSGALTLQSGGNLTQSGAISNDGQTTTIIAGAANVTLTNAGNDFGTVAVTNGATVSIRDTDDLEIGTSSVSGALTLQTGGTVGDNLTQIGAISNDGQTTTIIAGAANVTLTNASNDFGTVAVTNGATVSIVDSDDLEIGTSTVSGDLTLQTGGTVGDNLTQIGAISNDGQTTTIIAVAANVTLENTGNNFGTVAVTSGATVSIVDSNELILGTSTVSDTYTVVAGGDITQSGVLSVTSTSSFTAPGGDSVTLDAGWNDLQGTIDFNYSSGTSLLNVTLYNTPAITMAAIAVSGTLELRSRDSVGQSGILSGDTLIVTTYNDAGGAITLENAGNAFASVSLRSRNLADGASAAGAISYRDVDGFDVVEAGAGLSGMETSGSLTLRGDGNVGDGDNPIIAGTLTVNLNNNDLDFSNSDGDSDFDTVNLGTIDNVNDASFRDMNAIILGTCTVTGTLTVVTGLGATHSITQSGVVTASGGITTLQAGAGAITLDDASNNFATVVITSGAAVSIRDTDALIIGTSTVSGALTLQSGGNLTQSGAISNDGQTTTIIAGAANVTLTNAGNDFGTVAVTNGATVSIRDTDDLEIGTSSVSGALTLQTGGTVGDNLTQIGAISNDGQTTTIIAGAANVTLTNASNDFGTVAVTNGATVSIVDSDDLEIGTSTVSGDLTLQTGGTVGDNLTQIGAISNDGQTTTIIAVAANVTLENTGNNFGTVAVTSGATVSIVDSNELILGTSTVSDTYTVVAGGDITQSGVLSVTSTSSFTAPGGDSVTLDAGWNDLQGTIDFNYSSGTSLLNVTLYNTPAITMAAIAVSGTLELRSRDSVGQSGILSGDTLIVTTYNDAGGAITLENAGNAFASVSLRSRNLADGASAAGAISYRDVDGFDVVEAGAGLSGMETSGSLTLRGDGNVGDGDNPIIAGTLTVNLNNNDLDFSNSDGDSDFDTVNLGTIDNVNDASFRDMNAIILGTCTVTGTLTVVTGFGSDSQHNPEWSCDGKRRDNDASGRSRCYYAG